MIKNYFIIALRHLYLNPLYSAINIFGLTIGIACCILILTAVRYELSFDKYFSDADRIYRVSTGFKEPKTGEISLKSLSVFPAAKQIALDFPEVESFARIFTSTFSLKQGDRKFSEEAYLVDPGFFDIFPFHFIEGSPSAALQRPLTVVLTQSMARKYFGTQSALGKRLSVEGKNELTVSGVIEDTPPNTHFDLNILIPISSTQALLGEATVRRMENWNALSYGHYGYIKLKHGASAESIKSQLDSFYLRHSGAQEWMAIRPTLQSLTDIHLNPGEFEPAAMRIGHHLLIYAATLLAALILLIACINFINLTTARVTLRQREIGMRKVLGASRGQLALQQLTETLMLVGIAALLACTLVELLLPMLGNSLSRDFTQVYQWDLVSISGFVSLIVITTLMAGFYPAFVLSRLQPTAMLNGESTGQKHSLRACLTIGQFTLAVILIIVTLVAHAQFGHLRNLDLGFEQERVVILSANDRNAGANRFIEAVNKNYQTLRTELLKHPQIQAVAASTHDKIVFVQSYFRLPGDSDQAEALLLNLGQVDYDYINVYGMKLIEGRNFSREMAGDVVNDEKGTGVALLTRQGTRKLGFSSPEKAVNSTLMSGNVELRIIGVLEDVKAGGGYLDRNLDILTSVASVNVISVKLSGNKMAGTLAYIDKIWEKVIPNFALDRYFYASQDAFFEDIFNKVITGFRVFALIAIAIACLGLYAMASFITERRSKEIGIRKVLGASVANVIRLLLWDMSKPVLAAVTIAIPAAVLLVSRLLQVFPERVPLHAVYFLLAIGVTLAIAWVTVAVHTWRVANQNPAVSLRYE